MRAAVFDAPGDLRLVDVPRPEPRPGHVVLRVAACGVCGTDRHILHGEFPTTPPVVLGHEYAGEVVALGEGVADLALGDRVAVDPNIACGVCPACRRGEVHLCHHLVALGVDLDGGFAEYSLAPRAQCYPLPMGVSPLAGAMTEPLACCVHGIDRATVRPGDTVAIIGGGAIGLMLAQLARARGAGRVVLSDPVAARREMARHLGVDETLDPTQEDPLAPGGRLDGGAHVVIEAVGSRPTTAQALAWAAPGATVLWFGVTPPGQTIPIEPNAVFRKELTVRGSFINPYTHAAALALLAGGQVQVEPLITRRISLNELPEVLVAPPGDDIKVVVEP